MPRVSSDATRFEAIASAEARRRGGSQARGRLGDEGGGREKARNGRENGGRGGSGIIGRRETARRVGTRVLGAGEGKREITRVRRRGWK